MHPSIKRLLPIVLLVAAVGAAQAQDTGGTPLPGGTPVAVSANGVLLAPTARLTGFTMVWQQFNRCSAAALTIDLSYYGWTGNYNDTINGLNPNSEDVSVRLDEMVRFVGEQGLKAVARTGGTMDLLKMLVANGFPVLIENEYFDGDGGWRDWMSHNKVVVGYDDDARQLYTFDSLLGAGPDGLGRPISYDEFDQRWQPFNRDYLIIYKPDQEPLLQVLLGPQWDETANAQWTLQQAQADFAADPTDSFALFNIGSEQLALGDSASAAASFDQVRQMGLPWRMLWYEFGPFEAYLDQGRYDDVISLGETTNAGTPDSAGIEEIYYYMGMAYAAKGDMLRARGSLEAAVQHNRYFTQAIDALAALEGTPSPQSP